MAYQREDSFLPQAGAPSKGQSAQSFQGQRRQPSGPDISAGSSLSPWPRTEDSVANLANCSQAPGRPAAYIHLEKSGDYPGKRQPKPLTMFLEKPPE